MSHEFTLSPCKHPKFSINKGYWLQGNTTANAAKNIVRKEIKEEQVLSLYDFNLSVKYNLKVLKDNGIKVGKSYLYSLRKRYADKKEDFPNENNIGKQEEEQAYCSDVENNLPVVEDCGDFRLYWNFTSVTNPPKEAN